MKHRKLITAILLVVLLATACGRNETPTPVSSGDPTWDRIQATGKIVFGTSADYKPFESYDSSGQIVGFDPAIAHEIGARLGLQVEIKDYAFEGLGNALTYGHIDAAIAAISVTSDRQVTMDFTDVYMSGQDAVIARQGSGIPQIQSPVELAGYRVGVQRGTTYEAYIQQTLVEPGYMPASNLLQYSMPEHAVRDLSANLIDLVFMGSIPANEYVASGGLEIVGESFNPQLYAIALPKGGTMLKQQFNTLLTNMRNDGTLARFSTDYLNQTYDPAPPPATPTPPAVTPTPPPCYDDMAFVADITVPDWTYMSPGQSFNKTWRIRNSGTCAWDSTYRLVYVQGTAMGGAPAVIQGIVNPGANQDVTVGLVAPTTPGNYQGWWQMVNGKNIAFGQRIWVAIVVPGAPTAAPTAVPTVQPTIPPKPTIAYFTAEPASVEINKPVLLKWSFSGESLAAAQIARTNPDGTVTQLAFDVPLTGQLEDIPAAAGTVTYTLVVSNEFSGSTTATVMVSVFVPGVQQTQ